MTDRYTRVPRPTLWLVPEGTLRVAARDGEPARAVEVSSFYAGKSVVTNEQYEAFDASHARCEASSGDDEPVVNVTCAEAEAYCAWYAALSKKPFRLPTEEEWEHGCRAGRDGPWCWGSDPARAARHAWTLETSGGRAHDVESLAPNALGLHDTLGLVWEWTATTFGDGLRAVRGGSFRTPLAELGCCVRRALPEDARRDDLGFRIARSL